MFGDVNTRHENVCGVEGDGNSERRREKKTSAAGRSTRAWTTEYELRGLKSRQRHEPIGHPKDETTPYRGQLIHVDGLEHTLCGEEKGRQEGLIFTKGQIR